MAIAVDFETTYSAVNSLTVQGTAAYLRNPDTRAYLVGIYGDGVSYSGHPRTAPWRHIAGQEWVSHNRTFDSQVFAELQRRGLVAEGPSRWHCSADLAAYCGCSRALNQASRYLLNRTVSKQVRTNMKGRSEADILSDPAFHGECCVYALDDAKNCHELWSMLEAWFPEAERGFSEHTTLMCRRGIEVDVEFAERAETVLETALELALRQIPWKKPKLSAMELVRYCRVVGIEPPKSTAKNSDEFDSWLQLHRHLATWIDAYADSYSLNRTLEIVRKIRSSTVDGRLSYGLKYFGGHTGRWSGDSGLNMQNFPRDAKGGIKLRNLFVARSGHQLVVCDYGQIEARVLLWLAGDQEQLDIIRAGTDVYEAHARATMGYSDPGPLGEVDFGMRQLAKARVLGLGYQCGASKFVTMAKLLAGVNLDLKHSQRVVADYRKANWRITDLWDRLDWGIRETIYKGEEVFSSRLPGGRALHYRHPEFRDSARFGRQAYATTVMGRPAESIYGGKLVENLVQAVARDILAEAVIRLEKAGIPVVLTVHDEAVCEVPVGTDPREIEEIMLVSPEWAKTLPLAAEAKVLERYDK